MATFHILHLNISIQLIQVELDKRSKSEKLTKRRNKSLSSHRQSRWWVELINKNTVVNLHKHFTIQCLNVPCMVFLPSHHHRVTSEKVMEYTGSCPHPTPRGQGTKLLSNDVEREYTSSLQGDIQLPYATQTTSSTVEQSPKGGVSTLGEIF